MTYHEGLAPETQPATPAQVPVAILEQILEELKLALASDPSSVQAGIARLSAIVSGKELARVPVYARGGLAPWQKRRVGSYLIDHLEDSLSLKSMAQLVSLSTSQFCRAFKQSFGKTPHTHLMGLRIARAKQMMLTTREPLSMIALACGLADQAHLSKVFRRYVGQSPSVWRRLHDEPA